MVGLWPHGVGSSGKKEDHQVIGGTGPLTGLTLQFAALWRVVMLRLADARYSQIQRPLKETEDLNGKRG
jgi:hypothetical protein